MTELVEHSSLCILWSKGTKKNYAYYSCCGKDGYRFGGNKICDNRYIRADALEAAVWEEVKHLLKNPNRILEEYKRRLSELTKSSWDQRSDLLDKKEK